MKHSLHRLQWIRMAWLIVPASMAISSFAQASASMGAVECARLQEMNFTELPDAATTITTTAVVPASAKDPEYCAVSGYVQPQIQFELRLPTKTWNGRYLQAGCGGFCGSVDIEDCADALSRDFAVAAQNMGHVGNPIRDPLWGSEPGLRRDFGPRSTHVVALAAKAIVEKYYGRRPDHSYFRGCSTGGREALTEAQMYPKDFDGLIAGDPAFPARQGGIANNWDTLQLRTPEGELVLPPEKLRVLHAAVMKKCDKVDGLVDGIISDPRDCRFDVSSVQCPSGKDGADCLTSAQATAAAKLYDGPRNSKGERLVPGYRMYGSELDWRADIRFDLGKGYLRYLGFVQNPPADYDPRSFNFDTDVVKLEEMARLYDSVAPYEAPNLDEFHKSGGKLIVYHGWADATVSALGTLDYYAKVVDRGGGIDEVKSWFRVFMVPGMHHCARGNAPNTFDMLEAMVAWVERGEAPDRIIATQTDGDKVVRTRPLFPYPTVARYTGKGDANDAANWIPAEPRVKRDDNIDWIWAPRETSARR